MKRMIFILLALAMTTSAFAFFASDKRDVRDDKRDQVDAVAAKTTTVAADKIEECSKIVDQSISLKQLWVLTGQSNLFGPKFVQGDDDGIQITMPKYVSNCMALEFVIHPTEGNNDFYISAVNNHKFSAAGIGISDLEFKKMSYNQKYEQCMKQQKIIVKDKEGISRIDNDADKIERTSMRRYTFPIDYDRSKDINVMFSSPAEEVKNWGVAHKDLLKDGHHFCYKAESMTASGGEIYKSPESKAMDMVTDATKVKIEGKDKDCLECYTKKMQEMNDAKKMLEQSNAGNVKALMAIMDEALDKMRDEVSAKLYKKLQDIGSEVKDSRDDEEEVSALGDKYLEVVEQIETLVINPKYEKLKKLYKSRKGSLDKKKKAAIDKKIKKLNKEIGEFASKTRKYKASAVLAAFEKHGLKDSADALFSFKNKSYYYSKVRKVGTPKYSPKSVEKKMKSEVRTYGKYSTLREREYNARNNIEQYSGLYKSGATNLKKKRDAAWKKFRMSEAKLRQACYRGNPVRCRYANNPQRQQKAWKKALQARERYNGMIESGMTRYKHFLSLEAEAQRRFAQTEEGGDVDDFFFSSGFTLFKKDQYLTSSENLNAPIIDSSKMMTPAQVPTVNSSQYPMMPRQQMINPQQVHMNGMQNSNRFPAGWQSR